MNAESRIPNMEYSTSIFYIPYSLFIVLLFAFGACTSNQTAHEHADTYICPMHPTVVSDKPSTCPVCGMDLVRKARPGEEVKMTEELNKLIKSPNETVIASIKTIRPEFKTMHIELTLQGVVSYDERHTANISARVGGRLEKVFLKYEYQPVSKGQKVAEIYSAELVNAQRELLYLLKADARNADLIEAAKNKLTLLGASEAQIETILQQKEVVYTFPVFSQVSGYVVVETTSAPAVPTSSGMATPSASDGMGMGGGSSAVNNASTIAPTSSASLIREGNYVSTGQTLFKIVSTNSFWLEFRLMAQHSDHIKVGDQMKTNDGRPLRVDFIEPFSEGGEDFVRIRSYMKGEGLLIGQLVEAIIRKESEESLWLPTDAVTDLGVEEIVFVKERGQFRARKVDTGMITNGFVEIKKGLASGDEVATNAQYLVDSESFVKISN